MLKQFGQWLGGNEAASPLSDEQKLREISLEYEESELVSATHNFEPSRRLGSGNYGAVYRGTLRDGHDVAIKVLEIDVDDASGGDGGFADEVRVLSKFRHPNLVTLMGWATGKGDEGKHRRFLVYELLSGGDVSHRLAAVRQPDGTPFLWHERLWVALDAACGLSHMHNSTPKAFHRDIKSANILLDRSGTAKMADFGLSGIAKNKTKLNMTCEQISGTPGYACPHYIKSGRVTERTEVYAFGMVTLELLLNSMPACLGNGGAIVYPIFQVVMPASPGALDRALAAVDTKAKWPPALSKELAEFALICTAMEEAKRPSFTDVGRRLRLFCEQFCSGQRHGGDNNTFVAKVADRSGEPATNPQMNSHMAKGQGNPSGDPPTQPQLSMGQRPGAGGEVPTNPQMGGGFGGGPGEPPTRPQLGAGHSPAGPGMDPPTRPQLGGSPGGGVPTRPQMGAGAGMGPPTRPQMGGYPGPGADPPTQPQMHFGSAAGAEPPTRPQMYAGASPGSGGSPGTLAQNYGGPKGGRQRGFLEAVNELWDGGWESSTEGQAPMKGETARGRSPADLVEVVLECVHSEGVDIRGMQLKHKCLALRAEESPWAVGRQIQPNFFARLVPDESVRACISRSHIVLTWEPPALRLRKSTPNVVHLNGRPVAAQQDVLVNNNSQIGFCGKDNTTAFVIFTVLFRDAETVSKMGATPLPTHPDMPAPALQPSQLVTDRQMLNAPSQPQIPATHQSVGSQQHQSWWFSDTSAPFVLTCVMAYGYDVTRLPPEARSIGLHADSKTSIGRLQQQGLFEGLLGDEPAQRYLCCVSRAHLELVPVPREGMGCFVITNLSANPVTLMGGQKKLGKGDRGHVRVGETIQFVGNSADGSGAPVVYLKLRVDHADRASPSSPQGSHTPPTRPATGQTLVGPASQSVLMPPTSARPDSMGSLVGAEVGWSPSGGRDHGSPSLLPPADEAWDRRSGSKGSSPVGALRPPMGEVSPHTRAAPPRPPVAVPFFLVLSGSAVRDDFPEEKRRIDGNPEGLTIGRAHQKEIHSDAFGTELRQYLSRDHFRIDCDRDGSCKLVPLSSNPMWRLRGGQLLEVNRGEPPLSLSRGDAILLFTGSDDCTHDGPGNLGSLRWTFQDGSMDDRFDFDGALDGPTVKAVPRRKVTIADEAESEARARAAAYRHAAAGDKDRQCFNPFGLGGWG